jgi:hypothetical protein
MSIKKSLMLLGTVILLAVILAACGGKPEPTPTPTAAPVVEEKPVVEVPYLALWEGSAHNAVDTEPFRHWDDTTENPDGVPTSCAKCHTTAGYRDFVGADGSEANKVDAAVAAKDSQGIQCVACHNPVTTFQMTSVSFPGFELDKDGNPVPYVIEGLGDAARCMVCHQGRESKASVDGQIARFKVEDVDAIVAPIKDDQGKDVRFGFRNIHYFAAAATLYGTEVKGGYEYEGKLYDAKFDHVEGRATCIGCHNPHTLKVKVDECASCHGDGVLAEGGLQNIRIAQASAWDYDGDGNVEEGMFYEIQGLQEVLLAQIQTYAKEKAGTAIVYDPATYPYFLADADGDGNADEKDGAKVGYSTWTARLLKAAYNYQVSIKDPGAFAHGNKYIVQLVYDSIEDLGGDVSKFTRNDAGHFAGNTLPFRDWDETGVVPFACVKCHTAGGLPTFIKNNGTTVISPTGSTMTTGVGSMSPSNGFQCSTCHDEANWPNRYEVKSVVFPSGKAVSLGGKDADGAFVADDSNVCIACHQGRESTASVNAALRGKDADVVDAKISFKNIHYFAAGATLFGNDAQGAYQYEGQEYVGQNVTHPLNKCKDCHDVHALEPKLEACAGCHGDATPEDIRFNTDTTDWDGDGNVTEGIKGEIDTLAEALYAQIQVYATDTSGAGIVYNSAAYPYFFLDKDGDGNPDKNDQGQDTNYNGNWTPKLLRAAFNYQYSQKDPGAFVHNPKYVIQFLIDSIADLGGDVSTYTRPEVTAAPQ